MKTNRLLLKVMFMLGGMISLTACSSGESSERGNEEYIWGDTGGNSSTLQKDVPTSEMETFLEYVAKLENMKLQAIKLFSKNWEGELFCGDMSNANPDNLYNLMTEMLESKDRYEKAIRRLEQSGVLSSVTTRGIYSSATGWLYDLSDVVSDDEDLIRQALEKTKMMGNPTAQKQLFDALPSDCRQGYSSASEWFKDFNNGKLTNKAHKIKNAWYEMTVEANDATMQFHENLNAVTGSEGNAVWGTAAKVTKDIAQKGMDVQLSVLDELSGGAIGTMSDVNIVMEEVSKIRQKMKDGTLKSGDLAKLETVIGKNLLEKVLSKYLPEETENLSEEALDNIKGELADYVYDKELEAAEEDAAKGTSRSIMQVINNLAPSGNAINAVVSVDADGRVVFGLPNKDGDVNIVTRADKEQTITTTTKDGRRSTQKVRPKAGKNEINADPAPSDASYKIDPTFLDYDSNGGTKYIEITSNIKYYSVQKREKDYWIKVNQSGNIVTVIVEKNETEEPRDGSINIVFSQDKNNILKTITVPIKQYGSALEEQPLTFIDTESLMIQNITTNLFPNAGGINGFRNYVLNPENISVLKVSDYLYQVRGHYENPMEYHYEYEKNNDLVIDESKDYGIYFDISFTIESIEPAEYGDQYNIIARDIEVSGYRKDLADYKGGDELYEFSGTISRADLSQGSFNPNGVAEFSTSTSEYLGISYTVQSTRTTKIWFDNGYNDSKGNWVSKWEIVTNKYQSKGDEIFEFKIKW